MGTTTSRTENVTVHPRFRRPGDRYRRTKKRFMREQQQKESLQKEFGFIFDDNNEIVKCTHNIYLVETMRLPLLDPPAFLWNSFSPDLKNYYRQNILCIKEEDDCEN
jgi:hypothetical protein